MVIVSHSFEHLGCGGLGLIFLFQGDEGIFQPGGNIEDIDKESRITSKLLAESKEIKPYFDKCL